MKKLTKKSLDELAIIMPIISENEQILFCGGTSGSGTSDDPYILPPVTVTDSTHCVAYTLHDFGADLQAAIARTDSLFGPGNGVPIDSVPSFIKSFFPNAVPSSRNSLPDNGAIDNMFIWFQNSDSTGHAVRGFYNSAGFIHYKDTQTQKLNYLNPGDSCSIYKIY